MNYFIATDHAHCPELCKVNILKKYGVCFFKFISHRNTDLVERIASREFLYTKTKQTQKAAQLSLVIAM